MALWRSNLVVQASRLTDETPAECLDPNRGHPRLTLGLRLRWVALALAPSSLLLGVTTHISTDIAAVPLLWIIPLALYLLTFVLVFARRPPLPHRWMLRIQPLAVVLLAACYVIGPHAISLPWKLIGVDLEISTRAMFSIVIGLHLAVFFLTAMVCHGELAASRPPARHLTEFYLWMSLGGVLGGIFNAVIAPLIFPLVIEYPLMLMLACMLRPEPAAAPQNRSQRVAGPSLPGRTAGDHRPDGGDPESAARRIARLSERDGAGPFRFAGVGFCPPPAAIRPGSGLAADRLLAAGTPRPAGVRRAQLLRRGDDPV